MPCGHGGEGDRKQRSADAITDRVDLVFAGRLMNGVERGERSLPHVIFERLLREPFVGVNP